MRKWLMGALVFLAGCAGGAEGNGQDLSGKSFEDIQSSAQGTEVNLFMWGGDEGINTYIDEWVAPRLEENYDVTLNRTPMDTGDILQKLRTESQAGKNEGTIDILWLNGENFRNAKENGLLYGSFRDQLPHFNKYYEKEDFVYDFGTETEGMEAPWGKVQFALQYDSEKVNNPPRTYEELAAWIGQNPGKFTYPNPSDFTGNAFLRQMMLAVSGQEQEVIEEPFSENLAQEATQPMWEDLNAWEENLWRQGEHYPSSLSELDRLYSEGEVWMTMGYNEARSEHLIEQDVFPESTDTYVMDSGSLGNTHFLSIPFNSTNPEGAMTAINFLMSPEAQLQKLKPTSWGDNTAISLEKLEEDMQQKFKDLDRGDSVPSAERLEETFLPETDTAYVEWITEKWEDEVVRAP
ncbi:ABC transporter substrate-binding protein [Salimicrobium halophilum]|uniref:Putative spermidine/putrescine transport system substrate-binding protein n=1 Tax=Salimicrobium halophilum TaxID=86666 RepID=A0A1G8R4I1_9BACI|nr:ABC transporter substrate-binding protein [Salimicrobium halophilum]SDJ11320.1 putative spermidine/putrescine transport system substrate-binding protein [Salimicrobium halophilum]